MNHDDLNREEEVNRIISSALQSENPSDIFSLRKKYEDRLKELDISSNQAEDSLGIEYRTLYGLLDGNLTRFDLLSLLKLGYFLDISERQIVDAYVKYVVRQHKNDIDSAKRIIFILDNFDLAALKSMEVIDSKKDFMHIEERLNEIFGLTSILEFDTDEVGEAMSSTNVKPKNLKNRKYFIRKSRTIFRLIGNPNKYDKQALVDYFPKIRWHSTDIDNGILNVIRSLFDLGVTVIFQPRVPGLQMRGATFAGNGKPCIVLTDYQNTYPTLWFALLHELFHVLFDWEEILQKRYHLSDEENDLFVLKQKEEEANDFARDYLFPLQKLDIISPRIENKMIVKEFAHDNHVHSSMVYALYAYHNNTEENNLWEHFNKQIKPPMNTLIKKLGNEFTNRATANDFAKYYKSNIFNI